MQRSAELGDGSESTVHVALGAREYDVVIGSGVLGGIGDRVRGVARHCRRALVAVDAGLPAGIVSAVMESLSASSIKPTAISLEATETAKSLDSMQCALVAMAQAGLERGEPVVALGGGIVGDLAGFAAATYRRGVPVIQCPTTLLSMVDASVGGKTGVNLRVPSAGGEFSLLKNMVGAFHQPRLVLADVKALESLPQRQIRSGLAECIKHGMIGGDWGDPKLFEFVSEAAADSLDAWGSKLLELVARNVALKARVVAQDEREEAGLSGGRATLNLGHTFAHALETVESGAPSKTGYPGPLTHGEAVGLGLLAAATCARSLGLCEPDLPTAVEEALVRAGLPRRMDGMPPDAELLDRMAHDKKVAGGKLRLVLPTGKWQAQVIEDPDRGAVLAGLRAIRATA